MVLQQTCIRCDRPPQAVFSFSLGGHPSDAEVIPLTPMHVPRHNFLGGQRNLAIWGRQLLTLLCVSPLILPTNRHCARYKCLYCIVKWYLLKWCLLDWGEGSCPSGRPGYVPAPTNTALWRLYVWLRVISHCRWRRHINHFSLRSTSQFCGRWFTSVDDVELSERRLPL